MKRRALLLPILLLLSGCLSVPHRESAGAREAELRSLRWTGTAEVYPPGRTLKLGVESAITPFVRAQSETWILEQGRSSARTMIIEPSGGWIVRDGRREAMPALMLRHERQQFAIYGQMQRALARARYAIGTGDRIVIKGDGDESVDTEFVFDAQGRLTQATNTVVDPQTPGVSIAQVFTFSGELRSKDLRWPRRIAIHHDGAPYFVLNIETFEGE